MSLLSETSALVLEYQNLTNSKVRVGEFISIPRGLTNVTIVGTCKPTEVNTVYPLLDIETGERINLKKRGLLINNVLMESGANDPLIVNPPLSVYFNLVGTIPDLSDYNNFDNTSTDEAGINQKFFGEVCDGTTAGNYVIDDYPIAAIYTPDQASGSIVSGSIVVTLNCVQI